MLKITVASVHRHEIELFAYNEHDSFKIFLPISVDDAEALGKMLVESRAVAEKADE